MLKVLLAFLAVAVLVAVLRGRLARPAAPASGDRDDAVLAALAANGADLSKETEVVFHLYFPDEGHARSAAAVAGREGFATQVAPPPEGYSTWSCRLTRHMVPARAAVKAAVARLEELADSLDGEFDGWEAAVTR